MTATPAPRRLTLALKVPLLVAVLMIGVAAAISKLVLLRLEETQERHFAELGGAYLDGLTTALTPAVIRRDPWEAFDALDRSRSRYSGVAAVRVLVLLPDQSILAASDPMAHPLGSAAPAEALAAATSPRLASPEGTVWIARALTEGGVGIGRIAAEIDVATFGAERRATLLALIGVNAALTLLFATLGWLLVRRMLRPVLLLSDRFARASEGRLEPIPEHALPPPDSEEGRAFRRYNAAAAAIAEREALLRRLAEEERRALVGRYASAMAHEVNNPLGGLFNAVRMIERHGADPERRARAAALLERGLTGIHNVVRASLMLWRGGDDDRAFAPGDADDLRYLIESETRRRDLVLDWRQDLAGHPQVPAQAVPAQAVRQIALNLLLNACAASPPAGVVRFEAVTEGGTLRLTIEDQGPGLPAEARAFLTGAAPERLPPGSGLGLWTVGRLAASLGATLRIAGPPGTSITIVIPHAARPALSAAA
jgi:signal transduction histidine kinase